MTARFEVFHDPDEALPYRFRLRAEDGAVVAVSSRLGSICAVKADIMAVRESAATGLVVDMTGSGPAGKTPSEPAAASPEGRKWATRDHHGPELGLPGDLAAGFVFFLWHVLICTAILVLAGAGRLTALALASLAGRLAAKQGAGSRGRVIPKSRHSSGSGGRR